MCVCRPEVRTPFCGRIGCEWPKPAGTRAESKGTTDTEQPARWICPECKKPTNGVMRVILLSPCCLRPLETKDRNPAARGDEIPTADQQPVSRSLIS